MPAYPQLSLTREQTWADKDSYDRAQWFADHSDALARKRGAAIIAIEELAREIKRTGAHEDRGYTVERYMDALLDSLDYAFAPEVREWFDSVPAPLKLVAAE